MTAIACFLSGVAMACVWHLLRKDKRHRAILAFNRNPDTQRVRSITFTVQLNTTVPGSIAREVAQRIADDVYAADICIDDPRVTDDHDVYIENITAGMILANNHAIIEDAQV